MAKESESFALFSPRDCRIPRMRIPIAKCPEDFLVNAEKYKDILYLASIQSWKSVHFVVG
jgi:DIS3-like exonuclease 2